MSGYAFHPDAFADLDEIWEYIAQDNIDAADRVLADIHIVLRTLAASPHIGHRRPDLTARPLRFHVARDQYLIAYAPDEKPLWVLGVFHGRRNPRLMAAILCFEIESHNPLEMSSADNPTCQRHCRLLVSEGCGVAVNC